MQRSSIGIKHWFIALTLWLLFIFNIERVIHPVDITKYTYACVALVVIIALLVPGAYKIPLWLLSGIPVLLLIVMQIWTNDPVWGAEFPVTVTEVSSVVLTGLLAKQMVRYLAQFDEVIRKITINYVGSSVAPLKQEQGIMYKELKRARLYERPVSVVKLKITPDSQAEQFPEMLKTYKESLINQMSIAKVAKALDANLFDTDIIVQDGDQLVLMLPELDKQNSQKVIKKIQEVVSLETGYGLHIGVSTYPNDAVTFESLLEVANQNLSQQTDAQSDTTDISAQSAEKVSKALIF